MDEYDSDYGSYAWVDYKYDCTTIAVTSIHLSVYYFYVHLHVHVLYIHVQLSTITIHVQLCTITRCSTVVYHGAISSFPTIYTTSQEVEFLMRTRLKRKLQRSIN